MVSTGISGSTTAAAVFQACCRNSASLNHGGHHVAPGNVRCIDCSSLSRWPRCSLCRPSRPPCCIQSLLGRASVASPTTPATVFSHCGRRPAGSTAMPASIKAALAGVSSEHFAGKSPEMIDRGLRAGVAFFGAVAEPDDPFRRMPQMIGAFLFGFRRDRGQRRVSGFHHRAPIEIGEGRVKELPHHGMGEIAVRLLQQQQIAILPDVAQVRELVLVVALAFDLRGVRVQFARLAEQVEADIGERHVLFHHGRVAAPFRQPVPQNQRVVGAAQRVQHQRRFGDLDGCDCHVQEPVRSISDLILRSAPLRASRRMAASPVLPPSFETLASQAPQDEA